MGKNIVVLGSTGSIGRQALSVIAALPEHFTLLGLGAGQNAKLFLEQALAFAPRFAALQTDLCSVSAGLPEGTAYLPGDEGILALAAHPEADVIVMGISGIAALPPLLAALNAGKTVALANKESIVCGNALVRAAAKAGGGRILPVDSEQSAIFQCLMNGKREDVKSIILTASGGPFREYSEARLKTVTPEMALDHPTWSMGRKITIDSATLMNKGLEVLEAAYLFDLKKEHIRVLVHPQSIVHSMVEYQDGAVIAQLSKPDMRLAIQYAMTYPERVAGPAEPLDLTKTAGLTFEPVKQPLARAVELAYEALSLGGALPTLYNGANEAAVPLFLDGRIGFLDIHRLVEEVMAAGSGLPADSLMEVLAADAFAKRKTLELA